VDRGCEAGAGLIGRGPIAAVDEELQSDDRSA
jgi:hypothetical protein